MHVEQVLKAEFKDRFRNVSRIMDCVGCDKCRLWGKVQVTGLAAAMKVLFEMDDKALEYVPYPAVCVCNTELSRHLQPAAESEFVVSMQSLGRNVYDACKRSTVGCLNVISTFAQAVLQRIADWDGRRRQTANGDL